MKDVNLVKRFMHKYFQRLIDKTFMSLCTILYIFILFSCQSEKMLDPPHTLSCMDKSNPIGIYTPHPKLSWEGVGNEVQAIQIQVADLPEKLERHTGNFWDTGKIPYKDSTIIYQGNKLPAEGRMYWRVRYWNNLGVISRYSQIASWEMGLIEEENWEANYIYMDSLAQLEGIRMDSMKTGFTKSLESLTEVRRARLYIEANHNIAPSLLKNNEQAVDYHLTVSSDSLYRYLYVITPFITWGNNCFILNGLLPETEFRAQFILEFYDGKKVIETVRKEDIWVREDEIVLDNNICKLSP